MKKTTLILLLLMIASSLFAQIYRSNQLNQHLEELSSIPDKGYAIEVNGTSSVLYLDGRPVLSINESRQGTDRTIEQLDLESGDRRTMFYRNGLLIRDISHIGESVQETAYVYLNGHLAFCSFISDGATLDTIFFLRSSENDEPIAVKDNEGLRFMSSSYMFQSGELYEILASNLILTGYYEVLDSGEIRVVLEDGTYTYSSDGLLMKVEQGPAVTVYFYEGIVPVRSEMTDGNQKTVTFYADGKESEVLVYNEDELISRTEFPDTGKIQTLYSNGRELAVVYYKPDNRTVDRIEYR